MAFIKKINIKGTPYDIYATYADEVAWENITGKPSTFTPASHTHNYAGSSSAGGAANSAVKLSTARNINGVSFDGSSNITVTANPTTTTLTNVNLNDYLTPAFYNGGGGNGCTNLPSGVDAFGMIVFKNASEYTCQLLVGGSEDQNIMYLRTYSGSSWSSWTTMINSLNISSQSVSSATSAASANKLATARTIALSGDVSGSTTFDGSGNVTITANIPGLAASKITSGTFSIERGGTGATNAADARANLGAAEASHTHTITLEDTSDTADINLGYNSKYKLKVGNTDIVFKMPVALEADLEWDKFE